MQEWEQIKNELNLIRLEGCEEVRIGDVLHYSLKSYNKDIYGIISAIKSIRRIFGYSLLTTYAVKKVGRGNNIFFLSNSISNRADHIENMQRVMSIIDNRIDIVSSNYKVSIGNVLLLRFVFKWNKTLKRIFPNPIKRLFYISHIYQVFSDYRWVKKKLIGMKIKSFITYCDVLEADNYFTQMMNNRGVVTITLQHGLYGANGNAWATCGSNSDYFFCQGPYMIELASYLKASVRDRMKVVGPVSYANLQKEPPIISKKIEILGVFLDGGLDDNTREINLSMISIAKQLEEKKGLTVLFKFHPATNIDEYLEVIPKRERCFWRETNIKAFIDMIDAGIVHCSTSFVEMLYNYKIPYIYKRKNTLFNIYDKSVVMGFYDERELELILERQNSHTLEELQELKKMRKYFVGEGISYSVYKNTFKSIGIE